MQALRSSRLPGAPRTRDEPARSSGPACPELWLAAVLGSRPVAQLEGVAERCRRYTPRVVMAPPDAVLLEIRGSLGLFGGLPALVEEVSRMLADPACEVTLAVTPLPSASLLLARERQGVLLEDEAQLRAALAALPVRALGKEWAPALERMGVRRLRELWRLPRHGLARRFGTAFLAQLDRLAGKIPDLHPAYRPPLRFAAALALPAETTEFAFLLAAARRLLRRLDAFLVGHDAALDGFCLVLKTRRHPPIECRIGLRSRTRDPRRLEHLLAERLRALRLPAPVLEVSLRAENIGRHPLTTEGLLPGSDPRGDARSERIRETLEARLGQGSITAPVCRPDHRPEQAGGGPDAAGASSGPRQGTERPLWLLDPPEPLAGDYPPRWRGGALRLRSGPERIEAGWWDGAGQRRDYYRAVTGDGRQLWIFRDLDTPHGWRLHGYWG